uniref:Ankyrin repeat and SOCS box containing 10 n=1 Tax=Seriola lalandi dorsalis TaxID=1841481 RepID=A0A3B4XDA7_SERLL
MRYYQKYLWKCYDSTLYALINRNRTLAADVSDMSELTTPLHITAGRGFADCLKLLLQRGANVDLAPGGTTALHEACENCQPECTKLLLIHGADVHTTDQDKHTPLHMACKNVNPDIVDIARGENVCTSM